MYCACKNGARTINPCAHVVTILWYLFYGRYHKKPAPSAFLNECFPLRKVDFGFSDDEDEDENADHTADDPMDCGDDKFGEIPLFYLVY